MKSVPIDGVKETLKGFMLHHTADTPELWLKKRLQMHMPGQ